MPESARRPRLKPFIADFFDLPDNQNRWVGPEEVMSWGHKQDSDVSEYVSAWEQALNREDYLARDGAGNYMFASDQEERSEEEDVYPPPGLSIPWDKVDRIKQPQQRVTLDDAREHAIIAECAFIETFDRLLKECREQAIKDGLDMRHYDVHAKREILRALKMPMFLTDEEGKKIDYNVRRQQIREWHKRHKIVIATVPREHNGE